MNCSKRNKYAGLQNTETFYLLGHQQGASRERPSPPKVGKNKSKK